MNSYIIRPPTFSYFVLVAPSLRSEYFPGYEVQDFTEHPQRNLHGDAPVQCVSLSLHNAKIDSIYMLTYISAFFRPEILPSKSLLPSLLFFLKDMTCRVFTHEISKSNKHFNKHFLFNKHFSKNISPVGPRGMVTHLRNQ